MNAVADRITPSITTMIKLDHSHVLAVFHRYRPETPPTRKRALVTNACLLIEIHAQLEEEIFYPALREVMSDAEEIDESEAEHARMRQIIGELRGMAGREGPTDEAAYDEKFFELMRLVMHHVADEETQLLPAAERLLRDQLGRLGMEMTKRRVELMKPHAAELAETTVRTFPAGAAAGAALLTAGAVAVGAMLLARSKRTAEDRMGRWRH
ncbi:hemerythrin domain-containing protein [Steroidobacter cummioxidans]|uniref:hemerythrin domain-containing protein n=1 Tax=Steroidobacter cummioxidans TaxID=1803913 RepID=UPI000E324814|nr:hemerythrin domain-containing protein [Steroidobacter cummioxidans]